jgi:agmatine/peptidylarginine deiminase
MKRLIAEFEEQSFTQIIFPHKKTDWSCCLEEARKNFVEIINAITKYQKCLVVCADLDETKSYFDDYSNLHFVEYETNDCWARDTSALCVEEDGKITLLDFTFNGWGGKFDSSKDNQMTKSLVPRVKPEDDEKVKPEDDFSVIPSSNSVIPSLTGNLPKSNVKIKSIDFILEGGGVESNGVDAILTTSECMLNKNRNTALDPVKITQKLNNYFGATKIHYLDHGYLAGDDTDSHIDTLARFVSKDTIMYVAPPKDENDEHFEELTKMQEQLREIAIENSYKLVELPFCDPVYFEDERLPATYANFLFVNGAVLVPVYGVKQDSEALKVFEGFFTDRDIVAIDCSTLIKQHGSLHCVTMNFAVGVEIPSQAGNDVGWAGNDVGWAGND